MAPVALVSLAEWCRTHRQPYLKSWLRITGGTLPAQRVGARWYLAADQQPDHVITPARTPAGARLK